MDMTKWEEIPSEDLWEDGELSLGEVHYKICKNVLEIGDWKLIRRKNNDNDNPCGMERL